MNSFPGGDTLKFLGLEVLQLISQTMGVDSYTATCSEATQLLHELHRVHHMEIQQEVGIQRDNLMLNHHIILFYLKIQTIIFRPSQNHQRFTENGSQASHWIRCCKNLLRMKLRICTGNGKQKMCHTSTELY